MKGRVSLWMCSVKKVLLKVLQYTQELPALEALFNKFAGPQLTTSLKKLSSGTDVLPSIFAKKFETLFFKYTSQ